MGQSFTKPEATLLSPSMEGNVDEVKRLVGEFIASPQNNCADALKRFVDRQDAAGNCAMHGAVFSGNLEIVKFLAESCRADLTINNGLGCTPIWIAAGYNHLNCLEYLIDRLSSSPEHHGTFEQFLLDANDTGDSPFLAAASRGNYDVCKFLIECMDGRSEATKRDDTKRKFLRSANKAGDTPLKVAVAGGHDIKLLNLLLESDASVSQDDAEGDVICINRKNNLGLSPLIIACERNLPSVVELLIKFDADVHIRDDKGRNALAVASFCGCEDVVKFLLLRMKELPDIAMLLNEKDDVGCTPLWLATRTGNLAMVQLLIDAGADDMISDNEGLLPRDVALKFKKEKVNDYFANRTNKS